MMVEQPNSQSQVLPEATLLVIKGPNMGVRYRLGERTLIGRDSNNEIVLPDPKVSRIHAEIVKERFAYRIRDFQSRNGVYVNGIQVEEKLLLRNDQIQIGNTIFLFNPELSIENAIYSNSSVVFYPGDAATQELKAPNEVLQIATERERFLLDFLAALGEVFSSPAQRMEDVGRRLLELLMRLFESDGAMLFLRDGQSEKLRTVVAFPEDHEIGMNRTSLGRVVEEKRPLLVSERPENLVVIPVAGRDEPRPILNLGPAEGITTMCVPVLIGDQVIGVVAVEKRGTERYSLKDLALLHAVARLTAPLLKTAQVSEYVEALTTLETPWQAVPSRNPGARAIFRQAMQVAATDATVLIMGETGTGKEVLARSIHEASPRRSGPFIALNCGAIPASLFESELFGYERGAFTGALRTTRGKIELAHGGTLFLDEIGNLDLSLQPKILRFLQEHAFYRVGGTRAIEADVRIIAATNEDLEEAVRQGRFREDLWYRLNVVTLKLPPLRERREDIAPLAEHFLRQAGLRSGKEILGMDDSALVILERYDWPGNIRELTNAIERAVILAKGPVLTAEDFQFLGKEAAGRARRRAPQDREETPIRPLAEIEREHILNVLERFQWNQVKAAEALGVHRNTLRNKIIEYGLHKPHHSR